MNWKKTLIISLSILIAAVLVIYLIFMTEPKAKREGATRETAMLVDVIPAERGDYYPELVVMGTVRPSQDIVLGPRVSGEITRLSKSFIPGGYVNKGDFLLQIDPADYKNALALRKSELSNAETELKIEMGRRDVAKKDYTYLDEELSDANEALVLREPQLNSAKAAVEAAKAAVDQAELELKRTTIRAPFDAHILTRNVNVGSQVSPGQELARLIGFDNYWVMATVPLDKVRRLSFPEKEGEKGSPVTLRNRTAWEDDEYREGYLYKLVGALEDRTRLARVIVNVPDPLNIITKTADRPVLMIGAFMETRIQGDLIRDVVRISRDYIRKDETVWVKEEGKLQIRDVKILFRDAKYAYIESGVEEGEMIVTTNLSTVVDGAKLRTEPAVEADGPESGSKNNDTMQSGGAH